MSFPTDSETIQGIPSIDVDALRANLDDPGLTVIDVRPIAAYNGWRLGGETRGGHIPGAGPSRSPGSTPRRRPRRLACSPTRAPRRDGRSSSTGTAATTPAGWPPV